MARKTYRVWASYFPGQCTLFEDVVAEFGLEPVFPLRPGRGSQTNAVDVSSKKVAHEVEDALDAAGIQASVDTVSAYVPSSSQAEWHRSEAMTAVGVAENALIEAGSAVSTAVTQCGRAGLSRQALDAASELLENALDEMYQALDDATSELGS